VPSVSAQRGGAPANRPNVPIPRTSDGKPSFSFTDPQFKGGWQSPMTWDYSAVLTERKEEGIPFQPWAKALYDYRKSTEHKDDPEGFCVPPGGTRATSTQGLQEFIHLPEQQRIIRMFDSSSANWQIIYMDGRPHPPEVYELPTWMGHAVGHWEGDTLVVDTVGFNEGHWASVWGAPRTDKHHLIEKFTRLDYYTLKYEVTIDDPGAYTRPWTISWNLRWNLGAEIEHAVCAENNRFLEHYEDLELPGAR
jgi:hypothetical protein